MNVGWWYKDGCGVTGTLSQKLGASWSITDLHLNQQQWHMRNLKTLHLPRKYYKEPDVMASNSTFHPSVLKKKWDPKHCVICFHWMFIVIRGPIIKCKVWSDFVTNRTSLWTRATPYPLNTLFSAHGLYHSRDITLKLNSSLMYTLDLYSWAVCL